jgi:hypothetical protein
MLHLASAQLSARESRGGDADDHLVLAADLASATGEGNELNFHFGSASVAAWSVSIGVELERGPEAAERVAADVSRLGAVLASAERRSGLHLDLARGWAQAGGARDDQALRALDTADRIAPVRIRNDPIARDLVLAIDRRARRRVWELDSLKRRLGSRCSCSGKADGPLRVRLQPIDRNREPRRWARLVAEDDAVITQVDDGHPLPDGAGWEVTSSASMPTVVRDMLNTLDAQAGETVCEIGTGTGWNAALLASVIGAQNVVTIEVDHQLAERARKTLAEAGYGGVRVLTGDAAGVPARRPVRPRHRHRGRLHSALWLGHRPRRGRPARAAPGQHLLPAGDRGTHPTGRSRVRVTGRTG